MAYDAILDAEIEVDDAITQSLMQKVKDNFDFLYTASSGTEGFLNPSFDTDADSDGDPDNWTVSDYAGGSHELDATNAAHGAYALKFVHPSGAGNGGGYADSDYIPINEAYQFQVAFLNKCSQSGVKNQIIIRYFSEAKVDLSANETIYEETTNPTTWQPEISDKAEPPATAQYFKIRVVGGYTDTDPGSSTDIWFDGMHIVSDQWVKDRADTVVYTDNNVVFQDLDTGKDIMIQFDNVGDAGSGVTLQLSDDNGATYESISGFHVNAGSVANQTDNTIPIASSSFEFIKGGEIVLTRLPNGGTGIKASLQLGSAGGVTTVDGSMSGLMECGTSVNCFKIYAGGNFDQSGASVSVYERNK